MPIISKLSIFNLFKNITSLHFIAFLQKYGTRFLYYSINFILYKWITSIAINVLNSNFESDTAGLSTQYDRTPQLHPASSHTMDQIDQPLPLKIQVSKNKKKNHSKPSAHLFTEKNIIKKKHCHKRNSRNLRIQYFWQRILLF